MQTKNIAIAGLACVSLIALYACNENRPISGQVLDEARQADRPASSFPAADEDYYHDMDSGVPLDTNEVKGRNNWIVWTAGNDRFWDVLAKRQLRNGRFSKDRLFAP